MSRLLTTLGLVSLTVSFAAGQVFIYVTDLGNVEGGRWGFDVGVDVAEGDAWIAGELGGRVRERGIRLRR